MKILSLLFAASLLLSPKSFSDDQLQTGKQALATGDFIKAIQLLREATSKDKKNPDGFVLLGTALLKADSSDQALAVLFQARELDSANATIYELLGDAYGKQAITAAAIQQ